MGVPARLAGFALALVAAFTLALGAGRALGDGQEPAGVQGDRGHEVHDEGDG